MTHEERVKRFGLGMAKARQDAGVSQAALGVAVKSNQSTLSSWERGESEPPATMVFEIEKALGLVSGTLSHLLGYVRFCEHEPSDVESAIAADPRLDGPKREILREVYKTLVNLDI